MLIYRDKKVNGGLSRFLFEDFGNNQIRVKVWNVAYNKIMQMINFNFAILVKNFLKSGNYVHFQYRGNFNMAFINTLQKFDKQFLKHKIYFSSPVAQSAERVAVNH